MFTSKLKNRRVLLLQGPIGPFFLNLSIDLQSIGCVVHKLNFNGGDVFFFPKGDLYSQKMSDFPKFLKDYLTQNKIEAVVVFGDCRPIHQLAKPVVAHLGIEWYVFEEGYLRPNHITLELGGVNGFSELPITAKQYLDAAPLACIQTAPVIEVGRTFWYAMLWACLYYLFSSLLHLKFNHYIHHRPLSILEAWPWIRSGLRKYWFQYKERGTEQLLVDKYSGRYYLVPLQTYNDAQISHHSNFLNIEEFIQHIIVSFAKHAPQDCILVFKQHPFDRGYREYTKLIEKISITSHIKEKVMYIHDQYLPDLIEGSVGVVVINSTVGMSAVEQFKPVKVCGQAVYNIDGITVQESLDEFWQIARAWKPHTRKIDLFLSYLTHTTQFNGSFYRQIPNLSNATGVVWHSLHSKETIDAQFQCHQQNQSINTN